MEGLVVADTDVIIDFFSGSGPPAQTIADLIRKDRLAVASITVFELYAGVSGSRRLGQIDQFLSMATIFPFGTEEALASVSSYNQLRKAGKLIGTQDILIAGVCLARKQPLFTRNQSHFSRIPGLKLVS